MTIEQDVTEIKQTLTRLMPILDSMQQTQLAILAEQERMRHEHQAFGVEQGKMRLELDKMSDKLDTVISDVKELRTLQVQHSGLIAHLEGRAIEQSSILQLALAGRIARSGKPAA